MAQTFDVIVIGVGTMGAAACYHLAQRGVRVLGLEKFAVPHDQGAGHGFSRMIRLAYHEHPDYVPLLKRAYELVAGASNVRADQKLLYITGGLYAGAAIQRAAGSAPRRRPSGSVCLTSNSTASEIRPAVSAVPLARRISPRSTSRRPASSSPSWRSPRTCGWRCWPAPRFTRTSRSAAGRPNGSGATRRHRAGNVSCRPACVCRRRAGAASCWPSCTCRSVVTRQVSGWTWPRRPELFELGRFPVWSIARDDGSSNYGFPMMPDNPGFKTGASSARHVDRSRSGRAADSAWRRGGFSLSDRRISFPTPRAHAGPADLPLHQFARWAVHRRPHAAKSARRAGLRFQRPRLQVHAGHRRSHCASLRWTSARAADRILGPAALRGLKSMRLNGRHWRTIRLPAQASRLQPLRPVKRLRRCRSGRIAASYCLLIVGSRQPIKESPDVNSAGCCNGQQW